MRRILRSAVLVYTLAVATLLGCAVRSDPPVGPTAQPVLAMAALDVDDDDTYIRVVDVGAGLCVVVRVPGDHFMVCDAGHWQGQHCIKAVRELAGEPRDTVSWRNLIDALAEEIKAGASVLNLQSNRFRSCQAPRSHSEKPS